MIGSSPALRRVREMIAKVAPSDARVLITGESGTGKELVAAAIHAGGARKDRPFVRVNCAAIPRDLVESEMFGHERGAFTGATERRIGRFELADRGTLLLDEVGDLGAEAQAKLLRAIESGEIERVGGNKPIRVDVRILSATNKDLTRAVADGTFREDLFFRLNVIPLAIPPSASGRTTSRHSSGISPGCIAGARAAAHVVERRRAGHARALSMAGKRARARQHCGAARDPAPGSRGHERRNS